MSTIDLQTSKLFKKRFSKEDANKNIVLTKEDKIDLIDRINKSKIETIVWIVGTGVIQFVLSILAKKFL